MNHTAPHPTRCPVYLHPAAASNPGQVRDIQRATCRAAVFVGGKARLVSVPELKFFFVQSAPAFIPAEIADRRYFVIDGPTGGDAA